MSDRLCTKIINIFKLKTFQMNGKVFEPGQGNNAYIFPGVALGTICTGIHHISEDVFLSAAEALADMVRVT